MTDEELAHLMIESVRNALDRGVRHYDKDGRLLTSEKEIIETLVKDGEIALADPSDADIPVRHQ